MATLLFMTSMSYSISIHYCNGIIMGVSVTSIARGCCDQSSSCLDENHLHEDETNQCCHDETILIDNLDQNFTDPQISEISDLKLQFLTSYVLTCTDVNIDIEKINSNLDYNPSFPFQDLPILYQSFLL